MNIIQSIFFNIWYYRKPPWDTGISPPELLEFIQAHPPGRALDLGCGTGTNAITMAQHGWQVTGVDFIAQAIKRARKKAEQSGVDADFIIDDVARLNGVHGIYNLILDIGCFHTLNTTDKTRYIQNVARLLAKNGTLLIYAWIKHEGVPGSGILPRDITNLMEYLNLIDRKDSTERGKYNAVWLTFKK